MSKFVSIGLSIWVSLSTFVFASNIRIINGKPAEATQYKEVVKISVPGGTCTATLVGPKVIATAAHCSPNGSTVKFSVDGQDYSAKLQRSLLFPTKDHNIALGLVDKVVPGVGPASIGGKASTGLGVTLLGYGCTSTGASSSDGILRSGETVIRELLPYQMKSKADQGAVLCFGDSGGPAYVFESGKKLLLGINSHGNQIDENSNTRTDVAESTQFIQKFANDNQVEICGVNKNCGTVTVEPKCTLTVVPHTIVLGSSVTAKLLGTGEITAAFIDGNPVAFPNGEFTWKPATVGIFYINGSVKGAGGTGTCQASLSVNDPALPPAPVCQLVASPSQIKLGESLKLTLTVTGNATAASIQGTAVAFTGGNIQITPSTAGSQSAGAIVTGPGGSNVCSAFYFVEGPQPNVPNYTVIPTYCGDNTVVESGVASVCLGMVKYSWTKRAMTIRNVLIVTHTNNEVEVLPIILENQKQAKSGRTTVKAELGLYGNGYITTTQGMQLYTQKAFLVQEALGTGLVPKSISGRTALQGKYFNVDQLKKVPVK